ncbi:hypothetical protein GDO81_020204 [Engystomops pustulosus]|uniref:Uncharacterized protein n=1 Tax=Engystomops pustulosus TaxID=76066 RepID=A0AAV6YXM7_ENGPU|nr:hypothetical protein GDO81_020204 [Engystomops pustulosus]
MPCGVSVNSCCESGSVSDFAPLPPALTCCYVSDSDTVLPILISCLSPTTRLPAVSVPRPWLPLRTSHACVTTWWYHAATSPTRFALGSGENRVPLRLWSQVVACAIVHSGSEDSQPLSLTVREYMSLNNIVKKFTFNKKNI